MLSDTELLPHLICSPPVGGGVISMRLVSMAVRDELVVAIAERYGGSLRWEKARILDEFVAVSGYHRKHAMRLLREGRTGKRSDPRPARRVYDEGFGRRWLSCGRHPTASAASD